MLPQPRGRLFLGRTAKTFPYTRHDLGKQSYTDTVKRTSTEGHNKTHTDIVKAKKNCHLFTASEKDKDEEALEGVQDKEDIPEDISSHFCFENNPIMLISHQTGSTSKLPATKPAAQLNPMRVASRK